MPLLIRHINQFAWFYLACFLFNFSSLIIDGNLLIQYKPVFFSNRLDLSLNILMLGNLHKLILNNNTWCYLLDGSYLIINLILVVCYLKNSKYLSIICIFTLFINLTFALLSSISEICTIGPLTPNFIVPLILFKKDLKWFYFSLHSVRIIFIIIFFSAALWKLRTGAIFNLEQMSAILIHQHAPYFTVNSGNVYAKIILFFIEHKILSYSVFLLGFLAELLFIVGFFTKKYDKQLMILFVGFLVFNLFFMRIDYLNWFVFAGTLFLSNKTISSSAHENGLMNNA